MISKIIPGAALALATFCCAASGAAGSVDPAPTATIRYSDLNLSSTAGVARLYQRIAKAADGVCDLPRDTRRLKPEADLKSCRARVTHQAVQQIALPALSALHSTTIGRSAPKDRLARAR